MTALEDAIERFRIEREQLATAAMEMEVALEAICQKVGILAEIHVRAKDIGSFVKKAMTKDDYGVDPWGKTTDKVGARVITETVADRVEVLRAIEHSELEVLSVVDKRDGREPHELFYPGVHCQVVIPDTKTSTGDNLECEVQIRTKAEDLWSVPSHKLIYKAVLKVPSEVQRRVWRLSALTEVFDEEVGRAIDEISALPGFEMARLISIAESSYFTIVPQAGDRELSFEVLEAFASALPQTAEIDAYAGNLARFVELHLEKVKDVYRKFGTESDFASDPKYWLFSQPESVIMLERIENRPMLLRDAAIKSDMGYAIEPLFAAWGDTFLVD